MAPFLRSRRGTWLLVTAAVCCAGVRAAGASENPASAKETGDFRLLTYNVAGLPILISQSDPVSNTKVIGGLINLYDLVVVQEDFAYHQDLAAGALHPHRSPPVVPDEKVGIGDGLNVFSHLPFSRFERVPWSTCHGKLDHGSDCFAAKGFSVATHELRPGVEVDVYNVHMDAGRSRGDARARAAQAEQLAAYVRKRSAGRAVIVAGDTNLGSGSEATLLRFLSRTGLSDACRKLACSRPELIDRVMYRSSRDVTLEAVEFVLDDRFVRNDGRDLSDHKAVGVTFRWRAARSAP